jgi:hypothetical protein
MLSLTRGAALVVVTLAIANVTPAIAANCCETAGALYGPLTAGSPSAPATDAGTAPAPVPAVRGP